MLPLYLVGESTDLAEHLDWLEANGRPAGEDVRTLHAVADCLPDLVAAANDALAAFSRDIAAAGPVWLAELVSRFSVIAGVRSRDGQA